MASRSRDWLNQALRDLEQAEDSRRAGRHEWACFAAHQAAEKAVKAVFQKLKAEAWGHSVADLVMELSKTYEAARKLTDGALELDKAYIPTRYPNAHPSGAPGARYTRREAARLIKHAEGIVKFCKGLLPAVR